MNFFLHHKIGELEEEKATVSLFSFAESEVPTMRYVAIVIVVFLAGASVFVETTQKQEAENVEELATLAKIEKLGGIAFQGNQAPIVGKHLGKGYIVVLSGTKVSDGDLPMLGNLPNVVSLKLAETSLTDNGLRTIVANTSIGTLHVSNTKITDKGAESIASLKQLRGLEVSDTLFGDRGLVAVCKSCPELVNLSAARTKLTNKAVSEMKKLKKLRDVTLSECPELTNDGLGWVADASELKALWLKNTNVGSGVGRLLKTTKLRDIDLSGTKITDDDLIELRNLETMTHLRVSNTSISDKGVVALARLKNLIHLDLIDTKVTRETRMFMERSNPNLTISFRP